MGKDIIMENTDYDFYPRKKKENHNWLRRLSNCGMVTGILCLAAWVIINLVEYRIHLTIIVALVLIAAIIFEMLVIFKFGEDFLQNHRLWMVIIVLITNLVIFLFPNFFQISQSFYCNFRCSFIGFPNFLVGCAISTCIVLLIYFLSRKGESGYAATLSFYLLFFAAFVSLLITLFSFLFPQVLPGFILYSLFLIGLALVSAHFYIVEISNDFYEWSSISLLDKFIASVVIVVGSVVGAAFSLLIILLPGIISAANQGLNDGS
jgi:hypothetical protein